jgi:hypothetical protein
MYRKLIPLAVAIVFAVGCGKKPKESDGGGGGGDSKTDSDPTASYTMKLRNPQQGDKVEVTESESTTDANDKGGKSVTNTRKKRYEYTEHILEMPAGADKPTKLTRTYKVAERTDFKTKDVKALALQGKTVTIEKDTGKGAISPYKYTADGKTLDFLDALDLDSEFRSAKKGNELEAYLPKQAVKVGDSWSVEPEALNALTKGMGSVLDKSKSKFNCKLSRAYTQDGKQWGSIAFDFELFIDATTASKGKETGTGTVKVSGTLDTVIDGSARDHTMKGTLKGSFSGTEKGAAIKGTIDGTFDQSVKTVK